MPGILAKHMIQTANIIYSTGQYYEYVDGVYKAVPDERVLALIKKKMLPEYTKSSQISDTETQTRVEVIVSPDDLNKDIIWTEKEKKLRSKRLLELSDEKTISFYEQYIGQEAEVLFEKATRGRAMHGFTKNYIRVELSPADAKPEFDNELIRVRMGDFNHDKTALKATIING